MKKNILLVVSILFYTQFTIAQKSLNNYAYIIVPDQFSFQKEKDQYQLNSLVKFLFDKEGVKTFFSSEKIPQKYVRLDCGGLKLNVKKASSLLKTKLSFDLTDCYNSIIFSSKLGTSNEKEYKKAYHASIRAAFESFKKLNYTYTPIRSKAVIVEEIKETVSNVITNAKPVLANKKVYINKAKLSIELKGNNGSYIGYVQSSPSIEYTKGDLICKLFKTSLPNVFKVQWKDSYGNFINTIGYFDEIGNLKIDFSSPDGIKVMSFEK